MSDDLAALLTHLHPGMTLVVPNEQLLSRFPAAGRDVDDKTKAAAMAFAARFGCTFHYFPVGGDCEQGDGRFHKIRG